MKSIFQYYIAYYPATPEKITFEQYKLGKNVTITTRSVYIEIFERIAKMEVNQISQSTLNAGRYIMRVPAAEWKQLLLDCLKFQVK